MTGTLKGALKGALFGAIGAGFAVGIGDVFGHGASGLFAKGAQIGKELLRATAHGLSRGIISVAQGGTFKSGFASGFASSFFSPGTTGKGGFLGRTSISAIVGGTASKIGGGKFSNGAVSGAFVHMFNAENIKTYFSTVGAAISGLFGLNVEVGYYHNSTQSGLLLTGGGTVGIDASINIKSGYVNGNASSLDGWFTNGTQSVWYGEGTVMYSNGQYAGYSRGLSVGPLPYTATISQTYTVRLPFETQSYKSRLNGMVYD